MPGTDLVRVVVLDALSPALLARLRSLAPHDYEISCAGAANPGDRTRLLAAARFAIAGQSAVPGELLRRAPKLELLHKWGVGTDNIDLDTARELGIPVARTTGSNATPVAEYALGLALAAMRSLASGHAGLKAGKWCGFPLPRDSLTLSGKTVGIVGFGAIGQRFARLLAGFDCRILYSSRTRKPPELERGLRAHWSGLDELLARSDLVSLHCPLTPGTAGMIDRDALRTMKRSAILVNTARGGIVRDDDLLWALREGVIHAAAADVFEVEPLPADSPLIGLDNLVLSPHIAALAADHFEPTVQRMFANFERIRRGETIPAHEVVR